MRGASVGISGSGSCNPAVMASGLEAGRAWSGPVHGIFEPVVSMSREQLKRGNRKGQSTEATHRDGSTRSSDEVLVMSMERRGRIILPLVNESTAQAGGAHD